MLDTKQRGQLSRELRSVLREVQGAIIRLDPLPPAALEVGVIDRDPVGRAKKALEELETLLCSALDALWEPLLESTSR